MRPTKWSPATQSLCQSHLVKIAAIRVWKIRLLALSAYFGCVPYTAGDMPFSMATMAAM